MVYIFVAALSILFGLAAGSDFVQVGGPAPFHLLVHALALCADSFVEVSGPCPSSSLSACGWPSFLSSPSAAEWSSFRLFSTRDG